MTGIRGRGSARTGVARCGFSRLAHVLETPKERAGIRAVAEYLGTFWISDEASRCGLARCGYNYLGRAGSTDILAGMIPQICIERITAALTELPGGPADPRQEYATAYDNPSYTLHLVGDDLVALDRTAHDIRSGADRTAHIVTDYGTINTLRVGPPARTVRSARPRYDVQMKIDAEFIREETEEAQ